MLSVLLVTDALRKANSFPSQTFLAEPVVERVWDEDIFPTVLSFFFSQIFTFYFETVIIYITLTKLQHIFCTMILL